MLWQQIFLHFGVDDFLFKFLVKCDPKSFFSLWRRDLVVELQFVLPVCVNLLCLATKPLQIALERLRQGFSLLQLRA